VSSGLGYRRPEAAINRNLVPILRPSEPVLGEQKNHLPPNNFPAQFLPSRSPFGPGPQVVPLVVCLAVPQLIVLYFDASIWIPDSIASLDDVLLSRSRTSMCGGEGANDLFQLLIQTPFPGNGRTQTSRHFEYNSYSFCRPSLSQLLLEQHQEAKSAA
jgi:hypothetical protein